MQIITVHTLTCINELRPQKHESGANQRGFGFRDGTNQADRGQYRLYSVVDSQVPRRALAG